MSSELWQLSAGELAGLIRTRQVSSRTVVQAHLDRIAAVNDRLNALPVILHEQALQAAAAADQMQANGAPLGPLHGVPMTVKANIDLVGSATTSGVVALQKAMPPVDAPATAHLRRAGAIPIGRTNLPDFALRWQTTSSLWGATRNPWNPTVTPGGSSGGDAVALAVGMTPLAIGNDYGGSLRYPAQCCGVTALRPTLGRVAAASSLSPLPPPITGQLFFVHGPMARRVSDLRLALHVMSQSDARDPWWIPVPQAGPPIGRPLRVALTINPGDSGVDQRVADGVRKAARLLANAGYRVEAVEPPAIAEAAAIWAQLVAADLRTTLLPGIKALAGADTLTFVGHFLDTMAEGTLQVYSQALAERQRLAVAWSRFAETYPLILGPVATLPPFPLDYDLTARTHVQELLHAMRLVVTVNLLGPPAVVLPVDVTDGLPQAVQLIGARYREDLCLDAAAAIESQVTLVTPHNC
ncbi:MAG: amidase [Caldilineaceae bacterium]